MAPPARRASAPPPLDRLEDLAGSRCSGRGCRTSASLISSRVGVGVRRRAAPWRSAGCRACSSRTAPRRARRRPPAADAASGRRARPSTVVDRPGPRTRRASTRQESTGSPSTSTVQAPHSPSSQPCLVPVSCRSSRSTSSSVVCGLKSASRASPLTRNVPRTRAGARSAGSVHQVAHWASAVSVLANDLASRPSGQLSVLRLPERRTGGEVGRYSGFSFASTSFTTAVGHAPGHLGVARLPVGAPQVVGQHDSFDREAGRQRDLERIPLGLAARWRTSAPGPERAL